MQAAQLIAAAEEGFRIADGVIHADFLVFRQELQRHFTAVEQQIIAALDQGADLDYRNDFGVFFLHAAGGLFGNIGIDLERNMPQRLLVFIRILLFRQQHGVAVSVSSAQRQAAGNRQRGRIPFFFAGPDAVAQVNVYGLQRAAAHILHIALQRSRLAGVVIAIVVFIAGAVVGRGRVQIYLHLRAGIQLFLLMLCQHTHQLVAVLLGGGTLQQAAALLLLHQILLVLVIKVPAGFPDRLYLQILLQAGQRSLTVGQTAAFLQGFVLIFVFFVRVGSRRAVFQHGEQIGILQLDAQCLQVIVGCCPDCTDQRAGEALQLYGGQVVFGCIHQAADDTGCRGLRLCGQQLGTGHIDQGKVLFLRHGPFEVGRFAFRGEQLHHPLTALVDPQAAVVRGQHIRAVRRLAVRRSGLFLCCGGGCLRGLFLLLRLAGLAANVLRVGKHIIRAAAGKHQPDAGADHSNAGGVLGGDAEIAGLIVRGVVVVLDAKLFDDLAQVRIPFDALAPRRGMHAFQQHALDRIHVLRTLGGGAQLFDTRVDQLRLGQQNGHKHLHGSDLLPAHQGVVFFGQLPCAVTEQEQIGDHVDELVRGCVQQLVCGLVGIPQKLRPGVDASVGKLDGIVREISFPVADRIGIGLAPLGDFLRLHIIRADGKLDGRVQGRRIDRAGVVVIERHCLDVKGRMTGIGGVGELLPPCCAGGGGSHHFQGTAAELRLLFGAVCFMLAQRTEEELRLLHGQSGAVFDPAQVFRVALAQIFLVPLENITEGAQQGQRRHGGKYGFQGIVFLRRSGKQIPGQRADQLMREALPDGAARPLVRCVRRTVCHAHQCKAQFFGFFAALDQQVKAGLPIPGRQGRVQFRRTFQDVGILSAAAFDPVILEFVLPRREEEPFGRVLSVQDRAAGAALQPENSIFHIHGAGGVIISCLHAQQTVHQLHDAAPLVRVIAVAGHIKFNAHQEGIGVEFLGGKAQQHAACRGLIFRRFDHFAAVILAKMPPVPVKGIRQDQAVYVLLLLLGTAARHGKAVLVQFAHQAGQPELCARRFVGVFHLGQHLRADKLHQRVGGGVGAQPGQERATLHRKFLGNDGVLHGEYIVVQVQRLPAYTERHIADCLHHGPGFGCQVALCNGRVELAQRLLQLLAVHLRKDVFVAHLLQVVAVLHPLGQLRSLVEAVHQPAQEEHILALLPEQPQGGLPGLGVIHGGAVEGLRPCMGVGLGALQQAPGRIFAAAVRQDGPDQHVLRLRGDGGVLIQLKH